MPTDPADRAPRTLYLARGWSEVEAFLFGCPQRFNLYRKTSAMAPVETPTTNVRYLLSLDHLCMSATMVQYLPRVSAGSCFMVQVVSLSNPAVSYLRGWVADSLAMLQLALQRGRTAEIVSGCVQSSLARVVLPSEIEICKTPDGSDWLLGDGTFGEVSG